MRLSGLATIIGGAGFTLGEIIIAIFFPEGRPLSQRYAGFGLSILEALELAALMVLLLGLMGLYLHQRKQSGVLGFVGFLLAFVGTTLNVGAVWTGAFLFSALSNAAPQFLDSLTTAPPPMAAVGVMLGFILFPVGWILFGLASLRAKVYSRWASLLVIAGIVLFLFVPIVANVLLGAGWAWMGYSVWATTSAGGAG